MRWLLALMILCVAPRADASCSFGTILPVSFSYDPLNATATDGQGSFQYKCTSLASITIDIDFGVRMNRTMVPMTGSDVLSYTLYQDATRLISWGNTALTHLIVVVAPLSFVTQPVYGRIAAKQDVATGPYSDTLVVTVNF